MISIITVVFNGEKTIRQTIESVCRQTVLPNEYLIIDGKSTDNTVAIANEYAAKYQFIKVISEKDKGIYDAMNKGIFLAENMIIGIINSDDWYENNALETILNHYKIHGSGIYYGMQRFLLEDKEFFIERCNHEFLDRKMIPHPSTFVTKDVYLKYGTFKINLKYSADLELFVRYYNEKVPFFKIDNIIANFTLGGASSRPEAALESLRIRKDYNLISNRKYYFNYFKNYIKSKI